MKSISAEQPEGDTATYQGAGFNGRCLGEVTLPGPSPAAEAEPDSPHGREPAASEGNPDSLYCRSCNSRMTLLPSRRVWCPQCKTSSEVRGGGSISTIAMVIAAVLLLVFMLFYVQGTFDHLLYGIGLNWETCGLSYGESLCGDNLPLGADTAGESIKDGVRSWFW